MKNIVYSLLFAFGAFLNASAQNNIHFHFQHVINGEIIGLESTLEAAEGYNFEINRLEYYISQIQIVHDGGVITDVPETWLLVDAADNTFFDLGQFNVDVVEGIRFSVGVDPDHNHLDPSTYPADHPLAPQNPSMHWGWSAGYRFVAMEGVAGPELLTPFEVHALGDDNYFNVILNGPAFSGENYRAIYINADVLGMIHEINLSTGVISHGETGEAADMLNNFKVRVFEIGGEVLTVEDSEEQKVSVYPNPVNNTLFINIPAFNGLAQASLFDQQGRLVLSSSIQSATQQLDLSACESGYYTLQITGSKNASQHRILVSK